MPKIEDIKSLSLKNTDSNDYSENTKINNATNKEKIKRGILKTNHLKI